MNPHAESSSSPRTTRPHTHGSSGNLASINAPSTGGHFLFGRSQQRAQIQSGGQGLLPALAPACAALTGAGRIAAKLRTPLTLPFVEVNHVAHVRLSRCERTLADTHSQLQESWA